MLVGVHGPCFAWFKRSFSLFKVIVIHYHTNKATLRSEVPFSQWQWLLAWQLSESMRMPLQILKAMPEKNKKSAWRVASKKKLNQGYNLIVTKSTKKSTSLTCKQALCGALTAGRKRRESTPQSLLAGYTS